MRRLSILINTWQDDNWRSRNVSALSALPGVAHQEEFIVGMELPGVSNWVDAATFWDKLAAIARESDFLVLVKALDVPVETSVIENMLRHLTVARYDYLYFDGSEFGFGNNLRFEVMRASIVPQLIERGATLFSDGSIDAFGRCDADGYFPLQEDCAAYYGKYADTIYSHPAIVNLEGASVCNLKCTMCRFHGQDEGYEAPSKAFMDWEMFTRLVDEVAEYPKKPAIELCLRGEELMAEDFVDKVAYIKGKGITLMLVTNALLLKGDVVYDILEAGIDHITVSCEGATKETYEKIMVGGSYDDLMRNMDELFAARDDVGAATWITMKMVVQHDNLHEVDAFVEQWKATPANGIVLQNFLEKTGDGMHLSRYTPRPLPWRIACRQFFMNVAVATSGEVSPCNVHDFEQDKNMIGSLREGSLKESWKSDRMGRFQASVLDEKFDDVPFCGTCLGDTCKSVVLARWREKEWLKTVFHSVVAYQRLT